MERYQQHFHALGSEVLLTIVSHTQPEDVETIFIELRKLIENFENQFSRFKPESELSKLNNAADIKRSISKEFFELLNTAKSLAEQTDGLYNPFILPALQKEGYVGSWPHPKKADEDLNFSKRHVVPIASLHLDEKSAHIPANTALDFGGIGKGYLLDRLSDFIASKAVEGYWFSLGGDIICGGYDLNDAPWSVAVGSAMEAGIPVAHIVNTDSKPLGIATSGITKRRGTNKGKDWHHIIDPRTGESAISSILTTTVSADSATLADVYAKCIVIGGENHAEKYHANGIIQSYVLQLKTGEVITKGLSREAA